MTSGSHQADALGWEPGPQGAGPAFVPKLQQLEWQSVKDTSRTGGDLLAGTSLQWYFTPSLDPAPPGLGTEPGTRL